MAEGLPGAMSDQTRDQAWTPAAMLERLGGDQELALQLVALFIAECPRMMTAVRDSVRAGDAEQIRRAAHAFKGSVGNFTDGPPMTTAFELELLGKGGALERSVDLLERLELEVASFVGQLHRFETGHA